jgi:hypothetical protein
MSGIFGLNFNPTTILATVAMGPAGGLVSQLANQLYASVGQQIVSQLGQQLGMSQSALSLAQNAFSAGSGVSLGETRSVDDAVASLGEAFGASPSQIGEKQRAMSDMINDIVRNARENVEEGDSNSIRGGKGQGWLMAMAKALGAQLNELGDQMTDLASRITKDTPDLTAEFGVVSQQFGMLMNATTNAIKTAGEAMGNAARKG